MQKLSIIQKLGKEISGNGIEGVKVILLNPFQQNMLFLKLR